MKRRKRCRVSEAKERTITVLGADRNASPRALTKERGDPAAATRRSRTSAPHGIQSRRTLPAMTQGRWPLSLHVAKPKHTVADCLPRRARTVGEGAAS